MPFAPKIRKTILQALDDSIIPALQDETVPQILAGPPWDFSKVEHWPIREKHLRHKTPEPAQVSWYWKNEHLLASRMPYIGFVYEGVSDTKVGITTRMVKECSSPEASASIPGGIVVLRLRASAVICFPPGVPRSDGSTPYCDQNYPGFANSRTLWMLVCPEDILVHYSESNVNNLYSSHSLQVKDRILAQMMHAYMDELYHVRQQESDAAQGLLLYIMHRLRRFLVTHSASIGNTSYPPSPLMVKQDEPQSKSTELCQRTIEYILAHLRDHLTRETLANQMSVSPFYLNHVFRKTTGMSVIRYVNFLRIEAAKEILSHDLERIGDIAELIGFSSIASFSASFKRHVECSPSEFRQQNLIRKKTIKVLSMTV